VALFAHAVAKVFLKFLVHIKQLQVAILNGNVAGEIVDQIVEIQPLKGGGCGRLIFRAFVFFGHNQLQLEEK